MEENIHQGNVVWIKLKGYPWWPGIVSTNKNQQIFIYIIYPFQIEKILSPQECLVKFFIELSECKINISKIRPFDKYKEEFSKTKLKNLKNIIKIAEIVSKGKMSLEQHIKFVKKGLRKFEEQCLELQKIQKLKEKYEEKKKEIEKINTIKNMKKFKTIKKPKYLGKKRNLYKHIHNSNMTNMTKELICSIDEFIFHKREVKLINGYDTYFHDMKKKISESVINTNGLNVRNNIIINNYIIIQALLKLYKHVNNSRNFTPDISNKHSFVSLKNEINEKIRDSLFDDNSLFLSSSFNYFCLNYNSNSLSKEGIDIYNSIHNLSSMEDDEALRDVRIKFKEKNETTKKLSESEDDKSSSFGSKQTKVTQNGENKQKPKLIIGLINYSRLNNLLNINNHNVNNDELSEMKKEIIYQRIKEIEEEIKEGETEVKNYFLRKSVCLKLYKALHFAFKNLELKESEIKNICLYIEQQGRAIDSSMKEKYKEYIENIFKKISN